MFSCIKFDVISILLYVNNFNGNPSHLAKLQQLHPLQGKKKSSHSVNQRQMKQTAQNRVEKVSYKTNIIKVGLYVYKLIGHVQKTYLHSKEK